MLAKWISCKSIVKFQIWGNILNSKNLPQKHRVGSLLFHLKQKTYNSIKNRESSRKKMFHSIPAKWMFSKSVLKLMFWEKIIWTSKILPKENYIVVVSFIYSKMHWDSLRNIKDLGEKLLWCIFPKSILKVKFLEKIFWISKFCPENIK